MVNTIDYIPTCVQSIMGLVVAYCWMTLIVSLSNFVVISLRPYNALGSLWLVLAVKRGLIMSSLVKTKNKHLKKMCNTSVLVHMPLTKAFVRVYMNHFWDL